MEIPKLITQTLNPFYSETKTSGKAMTFKFYEHEVSVDLTPYLNRPLRKIYNSISALGSGTYQGIRNFVNWASGDSEKIPYVKKAQQAEAKASAEKALGHYQAARLFTASAEQYYKNDNAIVTDATAKGAEFVRVGEHLMDEEVKLKNCQKEIEACNQKLNALQNDTSINPKNLIAEQSRVELKRDQLLVKQKEIEEHLKALDNELKNVGPLAVLAANKARAAYDWEQSHQS